MHACSALMWRDLHCARGTCISRIEVIPCLKVIKAGELDREIIHQLSSKKEVHHYRRSLSSKSKEDASLNWSVLPICKFYCADLSSSRWPICTRKQDSDQVYNILEIKYSSVKYNNGVAIKFCNNFTIIMFL